MLISLLSGRDIESGESATTKNVIYKDRWLIELFFNAIKPPENESLRRSIEKHHNHAIVDSVDHLSCIGLCPALHQSRMDDLAYHAVHATEFI